MICVARMAELVDAHDSKSCLERGAGSIPVPGTINELNSFLENNKKKARQNPQTSFLEEVSYTLNPMQSFELVHNLRYCSRISIETQRRTLA